MFFLQSFNSIYDSCGYFRQFILAYASEASSRQFILCFFSSVIICSRFEHIISTSVCKFLTLWGPTMFSSTSSRWQNFLQPTCSSITQTEQHGKRCSLNNSSNLRPPWASHLSRTRDWWKIAVHSVSWSCWSKFFMIFHTIVTQYLGTIPAPTVCFRLFVIFLAWFTK